MFRSRSTRSAAVAALAALLACSKAAIVEPPTTLFLLAGQSNMAGRGVVEAEDRIPNVRVLTLTQDLEWQPAADPIHFDKPRSVGVGPGRSFGLALAGADSSLRIGLVPTAVGGTPISAWEPGARDAETGTHPYDDGLARARVAMRGGHRFAAVLWHQGESDAHPAQSLVYAERLRALIRRLRADLGDPTLPVLIGELGKFSGAPWSEAKERVDSAQRAVAASKPNVVFVPSDGLRDKGDTIHFDAASERELGRRFARAYQALQKPR